MSNKPQAIIIGSGIMGCSIAFELSKAGWKTLNLDKLPAAGYGSTSNSCAVIRVHYSTLEGTAVAYESYFSWSNWSEYLGVDDPSGQAKFNKTGILVFKSQPNHNLAKTKAILDQIGIRYDELDAAQVMDWLPVIDMNSYYPPRRHDDPKFGSKNPDPLPGAIYYEEGGYISDPQLSTHNVQMAAQAHGAEFKFNSVVNEIMRKNGRVAGVKLADGTKIIASVVVNAAGPHSFLLNRLAGVEGGMKIKTRPLRHEVVHLPAPRDFDFNAKGCPASDSDVGAYWRPEVGNHILSGSEDPECDPKQWIEDPDDFDRSLTDQAKTQAYRLGLRIPGVGISEKIKGVVDLYDVSDDWIPIYDKSDLPGFYMAVGTSGNQYKNSPLVGKIMAYLIQKCEAGHDHDSDPLIYHLEQLDRDITLRFYSRLRDINQESSFSVLG